MDTLNNSSLFSNRTIEMADFFQVLMENNLTKIMCLLVSLLGIIFGPMFLYIVIWFEKFGSDKKRTLLNRFASMFCWECIKFMLLVQTIEAVRFLNGPLPHFICNVQLIIRNSTVFNFLLYMDASILIRYIFIFWLKNPAAFKDDFWILFVCIWTQSTSLLYEIVRQLLNTKSSSGFYICVGVDPSQLKKGFSGIPSLIMNISLILHIVIYVRIFIYRLKGTTLVKQNKRSSLIKRLFLGEIEAHSLITYRSHILGLLILGVSAVMFFKLNGIQPKDWNFYPYNLIIYYRSLVAPTLGVFALAMSTSKRRIYVKAFSEEIKSLYL